MEMDNFFFGLQPCMGVSRMLFIDKDSLELICADTKQSRNFSYSMGMAFCKIVVLHTDATAKAGVRKKLLRICVANPVVSKVRSTTRETSLAMPSTV